MSAVWCILRRKRRCRFRLKHSPQAPKGTFALLLPDCYGEESGAFGLIKESRKSLIYWLPGLDSNQRPTD